MAERDFRLGETISTTMGRVASSEVRGVLVEHRWGARLLTVTGEREHQVLGRLPAGAAGHALGRTTSRSQAHDTQGDWGESAQN